MIKENQKSINQEKVAKKTVKEKEKNRKNRKREPKKNNNKKMNQEISARNYDSNGSNKEKLRTFYISRTFDISLFE